MSKQQMPVTKSFTSSNTGGREELCGPHAANCQTHEIGGWENFNLSRLRKAKGPSGISGRAFEFEREISVYRESWSLHRRVNFRHLHYYHVNCRHLHYYYVNCRRHLHRRCGFHHHRRRYSHGFHRLHRLHRYNHHRHGCHLHHRYNRGWERNTTVRSRSVTEPDSCGSGRNTFVAPSKSATAADCKSVAAANNRDCCWKV